MPKVELYYLSIENHGFDIDLHAAISLLDQQESERYQRFKNAHAQKCFLQARRIAKTTLAKKLRCQPDEVRFEYSDTEKPRLVGESPWHFNISHSKTSIVVAVSESLVGVDVEDIDRCLKICNKAEEFLNTHVKSLVELQVSTFGAAACFAEHWSCMESYIKLRGSAMYREKDRIKAEIYGSFSGGKLYRFENVFFTVFDFSQVARIAVAVDSACPELEMHYWRSGKQKKYFPEEVFA